jgi:hypothetical protein
MNVENKCYIDVRSLDTRIFITIGIGMRMQLLNMDEREKHDTHL